MYDILFLFLTYFSPYYTLRRNIVTNSKKTLKRIERERDQACGPLSLGCIQASKQSGLCLSVTQAPRKLVNESKEERARTLGWPQGVAPPSVLATPLLMPGGGGWHLWSCHIIQGAWIPQCIQKCTFRTPFHKGCFRNAAGRRSKALPLSGALTPSYGAATGHMEAKSPSSKARQAWLQVLLLSLVGAVTLSRFLSFSTPQFAQLHHEYSQTACRSRLLLEVKSMVERKALELD